MRSKKDLIKEYQNAGVPIWKRQYFPMVVVMIASICDFITIFNVSEFYLVENVLINIAITSAVAFILNFLPSLLGSTIADKNAANRKILIIVLAISFVILFSLTFLLRWTSKEVMFEDTSNLNLLGEAVSPGSEIGAAEKVLTILIGCSTLFTSVLSFVFSMTTLSKEELKKNITEVRIAELEEYRDFYLAHIAELEKVLSENAESDRDSELYNNTVQKLEEYRGYFKEQIRITLAEYLSSPDAVGTVLQKENPVVY